jgi:hypothetical protein
MSSDQEWANDADPKPAPDPYAELRDVTREQTRRVFDGVGSVSEKVGGAFGQAFREASAAVVGFVELVTEASREVALATEKSKAKADAAKADAEAKAKAKA